MSASQGNASDLADVQKMVDEAVEKGFDTQSRELLLKQAYHLISVDKIDLAEAALKAILVRFPKNEAALAGQAGVFLKRKEYQSASKLYHRLVHELGDRRYLYQEALCFFERGRFMEAAKLARQALPKLPQGKMKGACLYILGVSLVQSGQSNEGEKFLLQSLELDPANKKAAHWLAIAAVDSGSFSGAEELYRQLEALDWLTADFLETFFGRLTAVSRGDFVRRIYEKGLAEDLLSRGAAQVVAEAYRAAWDNESARRVFKLIRERFKEDPDLGLLCSEFHALAGVGSFDEMDEVKAEIQSVLGASSSLKEFAVNPWLLFPIEESPEALLSLATGFSNKVMAPSLSLKKGESRTTRLSADKRLRFAFLGNEFITHPVANCLLAFIDHLSDRVAVELYSVNPRKDATTQALCAKGARFHDVSGLDYRSLRKKCQKDEIDGLIDLTVYTAGGRPSFVSKGLVEFQANYLGFSGTSGNAAYSHIIADRFIIPDSHEAYYSEKVIRLDVPLLSCLFAQERPTDAQVRAARAELGVGEESIVFCSLAKNYKLSKPLISQWASILHSVPSAFIMVPEESSGALNRELGQAGVEPSRVIGSARRESRQEHLARLASCDVFLDSYPYNSHSLAADALTAGLPVVGLAGDTFASRISGSLLSGLQLSELITHSLEEYADLCIKLGRDRPMLAHFREKISVQLDSLDWSKAYAIDLEEKIRLSMT